MRMDARRVSLFVLALLGLSSGCVGLDKQASWMPWQEGPSHGQVAQVMVLWADGVVTQPDPMQGGVPTPGLAGRVFLFGPELGDPLAADGSLVVYLYDDAQPVTDQPVPRGVWTIDGDNLKRVLKKDGLGWGYNLWLPWGEYRPEVKKVTLLARYQPAKGREVWSSQMLLSVGGPGSSGPKPPSRLTTTQKRIGEREAS